jgi:hypothetical protein
MNETGCPVMTGRKQSTMLTVPRTETTKGTDPPQFPNKAMEGRMNKIEGQGQLKEAAG